MRKPFPYSIDNTQADTSACNIACNGKHFRFVSCLTFHAVHTRAHVDAFRPPEQLTEQFMMRTRSHRQTCHAMLDPFKNGIPNNYQGLACALYIHTCTFRYSPAEHLIRPCESRASWGVWQWAILPPPSIRQLAAARKNSRSSLCRWPIFLVEAAVLAVSNQFQLSASKHQWRLSPFGAFFPHLRASIGDRATPFGREETAWPS